jgi:8-oxo-dGTP diphosphatase
VRPSGIHADLGWRVFARSARQGADVLNESRIPNPESRPSTTVTAAVLRDAEGRVLLAQRTAGREHAGCWEFPGGKLEPGETVVDGLRRELVEELGITIGASRPLIALPWRVGGADLLLEVREVDDYAGTPRGCEGQSLQWQTLGQLGTLSMPPADLPVVAALTQPALYAITPEPGADDGAFLQAVERLLAAGIRRLQLRAKTVDPLRRAQLAAAIAARTRLAGAELLVNGDPGLAEALGCGLHLTAAQLAGLSRRPSVPLLAASCHDIPDLERAARLRCDFVVLGPVAATASHPDADPLGWARFAALRAACPLPVYALGGLFAADLPIARAHGAQGIAAIRGLWPRDGRSTELG